MRYRLLIPGDCKTTLHVCCDHFVQTCQTALQTQQRFTVALSGGSTPKTIFEMITSPPYSTQIDWSRVWLFWGDERSVPPSHPESNYKMAMDAGLSRMPIPPPHIHRMHAEKQIEENALLYEKLLHTYLDNNRFDLVMLGIGEDGHTASLFPETDALSITDRLVVANYVPQKKTWRMTLTFPCINQSKEIVIYALGASKKEIVSKILGDHPSIYPIERIGSETHPALWILDKDAASGLNT